MVELTAGDIKTAVVPMSNPTDTAFDYTVELYMGTNLALMASVDFHLNAGESKSISIPVTIPADTGVYEVYLAVFSGGEFIEPLYQAESISVTGAAVGGFVYSGETFQLRPLSEIIPTAGIASAYGVFHCTITNQGSSRGTRIIGIYYQMYSTYYRTYDNPVLKRTFELTLDPGESYQLIFDPRINATYHEDEGVEWYSNDADFIVLAVGSFIWYMYLLDTAGGESAHAGDN